MSEDREEKMILANKNFSNRRQDLRSFFVSRQWPLTRAYSKLKSSGSMELSKMQRRGNINSNSSQNRFELTFLLGTKGSLVMKTFFRFISL